VCAWTVGIAASSIEREVRLITRARRTAAALARAGADPPLAVSI
jgi:hypothetical protein